jgi:hypothetical protein
VAIRVGIDAFDEVRGCIVDQVEIAVSIGDPHVQQNAKDKHKPEPK